MLCHRQMIRYFKETTSVHPWGRQRSSIRIRGTCVMGTECSIHKDFDIDESPLYFPNKQWTLYSGTRKYDGSKVTVFVHTKQRGEKGGPNQGTDRAPKVPYPVVCIMYGHHPRGEGGFNRNLGRGFGRLDETLTLFKTKDVNFATLSKRECCNFLPCSRLDQAGHIQNTKNGT